MPDRQLLLLTKGDRNAFSSLFDEYYPRLHSFCLKYLHDKTNAEEIVQETFVAIWETRERIDPHKNFEPYLVSIARNKIYNLVKQKFVAEKHRERISESMQEHFSEEEKLLRNDLLVLMFSSMEKLPERQREILMLRSAGYTNPEIAERLNLSLRTVENHYSRALVTLRSIMGPEMLMAALLFTIPNL